MGQDGIPDHVGIVQKMENGIVYTVEGNSGDDCRENRYAVGHAMRFMGTEPRHIE